MQKQCIICKQVKELGEYYKHSQMADRHLNACKECIKERTRRFSRSDAGRKYDHERNQRPNRKKKLIEYQRRRRKRLKLQYECRMIFDRALQTGKITRQPCEVCGESKAEGHHEDYIKPLEVKWLCGKHHRELHKQFKRIG